MDNGTENLGVPDDEDILVPEVEIEETPEKADDKLPRAAKSAEEGIEDLKRQLEAEKVARAKLAADRDAKAEEAGRYRSQAERTRADNLANAVDLATQEVAAQKAAYLAAMEAADWKSAAEAQEKMAEAAAARTMASQARAAYEAQMKARPQPEAPRQYSPQTQAWIDRNPEFMTDAAFRRRAVAADDIARTEGLAVDTPAYFSRIEEIMGLSRREAEAPQERRAETIVAAPARSAPKPGEGGKVRYRLTKEEKEFADMSGVSYESYARNRELAAKQQGA